MGRRCVHLDWFIIAARVDVVVQADGVGRTFIEFRFSQLVADVRVLFFIFEKLGKLKIDFSSSLIFQTRPLSSFKSFKKRFCGESNVSLRFGVHPVAPLTIILSSTCDLKLCSSFPLCNQRLFHRIGFAFL